MSDKTRTTAPPAGVVTRDELWAENERLKQALDDTMRRAYAAEGAMVLALERADAARAEGERRVEQVREDYRRELHEQAKQKHAALGEDERLREALEDIRAEAAHGATANLEWIARVAERALRV